MKQLHILATSAVLASVAGAQIT
ncbi:MAG: hypothetical protein RL112_2430, partial [Planctomycetota bacterium]